MRKLGAQVQARLIGVVGQSVELKIESAVVGSGLSVSQYCLKIMSVIRTLATSRDEQTLESIIETLEKLPINKLRSLLCIRLEGVD